MSTIIQEYKCSCGFNINGIEGNSRDINYRQILHEKRCPVHIEENRKIIEARREEVIQDYKSAEKSNHRKYLEGDEKATEEYIYPNQKMDANEIIKEFYKNGRRVISITKKTKVGMDGLMIEVVMLMTTHIDDSFAINPANVRIITGMSNVAWERDMKEKTPNCFTPLHI